MLCTAALLASAVGAGLCSMAGATCTEEDTRQFDLFSTLWVVSLLGGPFLIAVLAFALRFGKTGAAYVLVGVALAVAVLADSAASA